MATFHLPRELDLRDQCMNKAGISQIKTAGWSGGEVSLLIYLLVETSWISPIHFSAMPLLWQPVCKYLLTLTRTKQCHCTSRWFSLHVSADCVCVRHWNIHSAVVCIPGSGLRMHVRVYVQMSFVDIEVLLMYFLDEDEGKHFGRNHSSNSEGHYPPFQFLHLPLKTSEVL